MDERDAIFLRQNFRGDITIDRAHSLVEPLEQPHFGIVAFQDAFGGEKLNQNVYKEALQVFGRLAESLYGEIVAISIDDE